VTIGAAVVEVTVAIAVAESIDPAERRLDVAAQLASQPDISGPGDVFPEDEEERRRIDRTVVGRALRDLAEPRERALPELVSDLPRLGIAVLIAPIRLVVREHPCGIARDAAAKAADLERRDRRIAAEERRE